MMTSASSVHRVSRSDGRGKARRGTVEPSIAGFKQSCMQFTNEKNGCFCGKMAQSGADIADNWKVPAVLRNLGSRMLQNSRLSALE
jgi:hypothetical protein